MILIWLHVKKKKLSCQLASVWKYSALLSQNFNLLRILKNMSQVFIFIYLSHPLDTFTTSLRQIILNYYDLSDLIEWNYTLTGMNLPGEDQLIFVLCHICCVSQMHSALLYNHYAVMIYEHGPTVHSRRIASLYCWIERETFKEESSTDEFTWRYGVHDPKDGGVTGQPHTSAYSCK